MNSQNNSARIFGQVPRHVISHSELAPGEVRVYSALVSFKNSRTGRAWPARSTLAGMVGMSERQVSRCTSKLESIGVIERHEDGRGRGRRNVWTFPRPGDAPKPLPAEGKQDIGVPPGPGDAFITGLDEKSPTTPPCAEPALVAVDSTDACGEFFSQNPQVEEPADEVFVDALVQGQRDSGTVVNEVSEIVVNAQAQQPELQFPEGLTLALCAQITRMLTGLPVDDAQALVDEMAWNSRSIIIAKPAAYVRKLLNDYKAGNFTPEVAHFERDRRQRVAENQAAIAKARLMRPGEFVAPAPARERTPEEIEAGLAALASMKAGLGRRH